MLILTRKPDEQILIGDDIKITLVRVRGNAVRIGIEAPRDVRVVRGELKSPVVKSDIAAQAKVICGRVKVTGTRSTDVHGAEPILRSSTPAMYRRNLQTERSTTQPGRTPLGDFVSAT